MTPARSPRRRRSTRGARGRAGGYPGLTVLVADIVSGGEGSELYSVALPGGYVDLPVDDASARLRAEHHATVLAVLRGTTTIANPPADLRILAGDGRSSSRSPSASRDRRRPTSPGPPLSRTRPPHPTPPAHPRPRNPLRPHPPSGERREPRRPGSPWCTSAPAVHQEVHPRLGSAPRAARGQSAPCASRAAGSGGRDQAGAGRRRVPRSGQAAAPAGTVTRRRRCFRHVATPGRASPERPAPGP